MTICPSAANKTEQMLRDYLFRYQIIGSVLKTVVVQIDDHDVPCLV